MYRNRINWLRSFQLDSFIFVKFRLYITYSAFVHCNTHARARARARPHTHTHMHIHMQKIYIILRIEL